MNPKIEILTCLSLLQVLAVFASTGDAHIQALIQSNMNSSQLLSIPIAYSRMAMLKTEEEAGDLLNSAANFCSQNPAACPPVTDAILGSIRVAHDALWQIINAFQGGQGTATASGNMEIPAAPAAANTQPPPVPSA